MIKYEPLNVLSETALSKLSMQSFFFGHQSVGVDITEGLASVLRGAPNVHVKLVLSEDPVQLESGAFVHSRIGVNGKPLTKIRAFEKLLDDGIGDRADVAFMKFCYVDAGSGSDIDVSRLFWEYKRSIRTLQTKFPKTCFAHFTMPLRTIPESVKLAVRRLLGRGIEEYADNIQRNQFNQMLRNEYRGKEPLFDIAHLESVAPSAVKAKEFYYRGERYEALAPENTNDGGHLNEQGKRWIAEQLLVFLANLACEAQSKPYQRNAIRDV